MTNEELAVLEGRVEITNVEVATRKLASLDAAYVKSASTATKSELQISKAAKGTSAAVSGGALQRQAAASVAVKAATTSAAAHARASSSVSQSSAAAAGSVVKAELEIARANLASAKQATTAATEKVAAHAKTAAAAQKAVFAQRQAENRLIAANAAATRSVTGAAASQVRALNQVELATARTAVAQQARARKVSGTVATQARMVTAAEMGVQTSAMRQIQAVQKVGAADQWAADIKAKSVAQNVAAEQRAAVATEAAAARKVSVLERQVAAEEAAAAARVAAVRRQEEMEAAAAARAVRRDEMRSAAWAKQKESLTGFGRLVKRTTLITGGLAAVGVGAGLKLNAQWESQQASFATLLGSMKKAERFTERLRSVSAESPLKLTEYAEGSKLLLGFGMSAKKVVPTLSAVNKAVVATGQGEEAMMRITRALGKIQGRGKATAEELNMLTDANVPVQKILQKELGLTGDQVANIGALSGGAGKAIKALEKAGVNVNRVTRREFGKTSAEVARTGDGLGRVFTVLSGEGVPVNRILRRELGMTRGELAKLSGSGLSAGKVIGAIARGWRREYGPAYKNASETWLVQTARMKKGFEQLLRLGTESLFKDLTRTVLPSLNKELTKATDTLSNPKLTDTQKLDRLSRNFESLGGKLAKFAERGADGFVKAFDRLFPIFTKAISPLIDAAMKVFPKLVAQLSPVVAAGAGKLATAFVTGFTQAPILGKLLIGSWVFTKLGGVAAIRAAGTTAGAQFAQGMAAGATGGAAAGGAAAGTAAGAAAAGGFAAKMKGMAGAASRFGGIALALTAGLELADDMVSKSASDAMAELDRIEQKGKGVRGTVGRMLGPLDISFTKGDTIAGYADSAEKLKGVLGEIATAQVGQVSALRAEGLERLKNLDLTKEQAGEVRRLLNQRPEQFTNLQAGIDRLAGGQITRLNDITRLTRENARAAAQAYGKDSSEWRSASARNMNAAISAIRAGMHQGVIGVSKGKARIKALLARRDLVRGANVGGIAKGFRQTWLNSGKITGRGIKGIVADLKKMPGPAREQAQKMLVGMARQLEKGKKLPEGSMSKLRSALVTEFGKTSGGLEKKLKGQRDAWRRNYDKMGNVVDGFGKKTSKKLKPASEAVKKHADVVAAARKRNVGNWNALPPILSTSVTEMIGDYQRGKGAISGGKPQKKRRGGLIQRFRRGGGIDTATVAVSPGEEIHHKGKAFRVPGRPVARDSVIMDAPVGAKVLTFDGQMRMAHGASLNQAIAKQRPHFGAGAPPLPRFAEGGKIEKPRIASGPPYGREIGNLAIDKVHSLATAKLKKLREQAAAAAVPGAGGYMSGTWKKARQLAAKFGLTITSSYRSPAHNAAVGGVSGSSHTKGSPSNPGAHDFVPPSAPSGPGRAGLYAMNALGAKWADNHDFGSGLHLHVSWFRRGGLVQRLGKGGKVKLPVRWGRNQLATLAKVMGMANPGLMSQIALAESGGNAKLDNTGLNPDGSVDYGLWQINSIHGKPKSRMLDPIWNARYARDILKSQGLSAWVAYSNGSYARHAAGKVDPKFAAKLRKAMSQGYVLADGSGGAEGTGPKKPPATKKQRQRFKTLRGKASGLLKRAQKLKGRYKQLGGTKQGRKAINRAVDLSRKASAKAKLGDKAAAKKVLARAKKQLKQGRSYFKTAKENVFTPGYKASSLPGLAHAGTFDPTKKFSVRNLPGWGKIDKATRQRLKGPGMTWQGRQSVLEEAFARAQLTETLDDDAAILNAQLGLHQRKRKHLRKQLNKSNRRLKSGKLTKAQRKKEREKRDRILSDLSSTTGDISSTREAIRGLNEQGEEGSSADLAEELKALREEIAKQTAAMQRGFDADSRVLRQLLTDALSGSLAGQADPPARLGFSPAVNF